MARPARLESSGIEWALAFLVASAGFAAASAAASAAGAGPRLLRQVTRQQVVVTVALVAGAAAAVGSTASATGTPLVDPAYRAALVGLTTYLGARLRLPALAVATAATAAFSGGHGWAALAASAAVGAVVAWQLMGRSSGSGRAAGPAAVTAACCAMSLLQPGATLPRGLSALGSAAVVVVVCALGYSRTADPVRRRVRLAGLAMAAVVGAGGVLAVVALAQARPPLQLGISAATRARVQASDLDSQAAGRSMKSAAAAFERANRHVRSPLGRVGAVVPLLSQHVRAVDVATASGADLGGAGADLAEAVDQDSLRIVDGRVPLERLQQAQPKAARAASALSKARRALSDHRSPWLAPPLASRLDRVESQLATAGDEADRAAALLSEVPLLLGSKAPRRYFVALQTSSEMRGSGGFMGSFAEISADDGRLALTRTGRPAELNANRSAPRRSLDAPEDFIRRYGRFRVEDTWESVTISPHSPPTLRSSGASTRNRGAGPAGRRRRRRRPRRHPGDPPGGGPRAGRRGARAAHR